LFFVFCFIGDQLDIRAGDIDHKSHHDNEIDLFEAHYESDSWANYFIHIGRLTCDGDDMLNSSESTTIEEFLKEYKPRQLRSKSNGRSDQL
jgi:cysteinyl-tRNA synthetase